MNEKIGLRNCQKLCNSSYSFFVGAQILLEKIGLRNCQKLCNSSYSFFVRAQILLLGRPLVWLLGLALIQKLVRFISLFINCMYSAFANFLVLMGKILWIGSCIA